jgi:hypothetical protein
MRNSFHTFVPTGKVHSSIFEVSIVVPAGIWMNRLLSAPSLHRWYAGSYGIAVVAIERVPQLA